MTQKLGGGQNFEIRSEETHHHKFKPELCNCQIPPFNQEDLKLPYLNQGVDLIILQSYKFCICTIVCCKTFETCFAREKRLLNHAEKRKEGEKR